MNPLNDDIATEGFQASRSVQVRAGLLLALSMVLVLGAVLYILSARGYFAKTHTVVLVADDSEGVTVGMDMTFAGFPIGRVAQMDLSPEGKALIIVQIPQEDAKWLRTSTMFVLERNLVGATKLRAFTGVITDPPLPNGAKKDVLRGDAGEEIPKLTANVRDILANIATLTNQDSPLSQSLVHLQVAGSRLSGPNGAVGMLMGNDAEVKKVQLALAQTNALLARLDTVGAKTGSLLDSAKTVADSAKGVADKADALVAKADGIVAKADSRIFGASPADASLLADTQATVKQLNNLLADARGSLAKVDGVLREVQGTAANTKEATQDLGALRTEVEGSLRKVDSLVNEINRKWPFKREAEVKLP